jgi:hypothetical protein
MQERARRAIQILIDHQSEAGIDIANAMAQVWFTEAGVPIGNQIRTYS